MWNFPRDDAGRKLAGYLRVSAVMGESTCRTKQVVCNGSQCGFVLTSVLLFQITIATSL